MEQQPTTHHWFLTKERIVRIPRNIHERAHRFLEFINLVNDKQSKLFDFMTINKDFKISMYLDLYWDSKECQQRQLLLDILYLRGCDYLLETACRKTLPEREKALHQKTQIRIRAIYQSLEAKLSKDYLAKAS